jgi:hypothetical protein
METVNERLKHFIEEVVKPKSLRAFDSHIGVAETHTNNIVGKKQNMPNGSYFQKLKEKYPNLSLDWLISGDGEMFKPVNEFKETQEEVNRLKAENDSLLAELQGSRFALSVVAKHSNFQQGNVAVNFKVVSNKKPVSQRVGVIIPFFADSIADRSYSTPVIA